MQRPNEGCAESAQGFGRILPSNRPRNLKEIVGPSSSAFGTRRALSTRGLKSLSKVEVQIENRAGVPYGRRTDSIKECCAPDQRLCGGDVPFGRIWQLRHPSLLGNE